MEGQRGSMRVCPASTAELSKCSFFVQRTKPWLVLGFCLFVCFCGFFVEVGFFFSSVIQI